MSKKLRFEAELVDLMADDCPWKLDGYHPEDFYSMACSAFKEVERLRKEVESLRTGDEEAEDG